MFAVSEFLHGEMHFYVQKTDGQKISPDFYIPGGRAFEASNTSLDIFCQLFPGNNFALYHAIFQVHEDCILHMRPFEESFTCRLMLRGHLLEEFDGSLIEHKQGQVLLSYDKTEAHVLHFKGERVYEMLVQQLFAGLNLPIVTTNISNRRPLWGHYKMLDSALQLMKNPGKQQFLDEFRRLVADATIKAPDKEFSISESQVDKLFQVQKQIKQQFQQKANIREWASKAQMNTTTFKYLFKQVFKETPYNYLLETRLEAAKKLASEEPDLGFAEIAERCGFGNYNNLRRVFYTKEKLTLTAWRKLKTLFQLFVASHIFDLDAYSI